MKVSAPMETVYRYIAEGLIKFLVSRGIPREVAGLAKVTIHLDGSGGGEFIFELPEYNGGNHGQEG